MAMDKLTDWLDATLFRRWLAFLAPGGAAFLAGWAVLEPLGVSPGVHTTVSLLLFSGFAVLGSYSLLVKRRLRRYVLTGPRHRQLPHTDTVPTLRKTVGVIAPLSTWTTDFYFDLVSGIRAAAERESPTHQRRIVVFDIPQESYESVADLATFTTLETSVDGIISVNIRMPDDLLERLRMAGIPVLNVFHEDHGPPFIGNIIPNHSGFRELLQALVMDQAAQPVILVSKPLDNPYKKTNADPYRKDKRDAFVEAVKRADLRLLKTSYYPQTCEALRTEEPDFAAIVEVDAYDYSVGQQLFDQCLMYLPENAAVVCLADVVAAGIIFSAVRSGHSCEERHLRVTGFDNTPIAQELDLTTIDYRLGLAGRLAYDKIQAAIEHGVALNTTTERVDCEYVERRSNRW